MTNCAVLLLTYNGESIVTQCLDSLLSQNYKADIFVIDNGSTDLTSSTLAAYDSITVLSLPYNHSFAAAYNFAYSSLSTCYEFVFVVSNDIHFVDESTLSELISQLVSNPTIGAVAPASLRPDGSFDYIAKPRLNVLDLFYTYTTPFSLRLFSSRYPDVSRISSAMVLQDSCILIRREALANDYIFSPHFKFYYTEDDLSQTIIHNGFSLLYYPSTCVEHLVSYSTEKRDLSYYYLISFLDYLHYIKKYMFLFYPLFLILTPPFFLIRYLRIRFRSSL